LGIVDPEVLSGTFHFKDGEGERFAIGREVAEFYSGIGGADGGEGTALAVDPGELGAADEGGVGKRSLVGDGEIGGTGGEERVDFAGDGDGFAGEAKGLRIEGPGKEGAAADVEEVAGLGGGRGGGVGDAGIGFEERRGGTAGEGPGVGSVAIDLGIPFHVEDVFAAR